MAALTLLQNTENWVLTQKDLNKIKSAETKFLGSVKDCSILDKINNGKIIKWLEIDSTTNKIIDSNGEKHAAKERKQAPKGSPRGKKKKKWINK